jgi:hypothetical protein
VIEDTLIDDAVLRELTVSDEMGPVPPPDPVPGSAPLIVDTVMVDKISADAVMVLPVRVDKLIVAAFTLAKFAEYRVR